MLKPNKLNQRGIAIFEILPILIIFILLINFTFGFFGIIHTGILNSIAARNYAFETFRNRANLDYLRDEGAPAVDCCNEAYQVGYNSKFGYRWHTIVGENTYPDTFHATKRSIKFSETVAGSGGADQNTIHAEKIGRIVAGKKVSDTNSEIDQDSFTQVWVRTIYGICLNSKCGGG